MSKELIEREIKNFLATATPEVLCIRGKWGIGKTFSWKRYLGEAQRDGRIALGQYAYVSLFGANSLDELKYSIFENTVPKENVSQEANIDTLKVSVDKAKVYGRRWAWLLDHMPIVKSYVGGAAPVFFLLVHDQIVCIDDLERKGTDLNVGDILGLISFLKDQRRCKVVLLLNDEALEGEARQEFERYLEKVIDVSVKFIPSAEDSVRIAVPEKDRCSELVAKNCIALKISNIRVIKKIERFVKAIEPLVSGADDLVLKQISQSITLLVWSVYQPDEAPPLDYLKDKKKEFFGEKRPEEVPEDHAAWNALLDAYGFAYMDEFDFVILESVKNGFFDPAVIRKHATELDGKIKGAKAEESFEGAWRKYHDSFENNEDEVLDGLYSAFMRTFRHISPLNLAGTVRLFKDLGRRDQASQMIRNYVSEPDKDRKFFDLQQYPFAGDIDDPEIIEAFRAKAASFPVRENFANLLLDLQDKGLDNALITQLASGSVDQYYEAFKGNSGTNLSKMISASLQFDRIINSTNDMKQISRKAREALERIGKESPINARRVAKYGITEKKAAPPLPLQE